MGGSPDIELLSGGSYKSRHSACLGDVAVRTNTGGGGGNFGEFGESGAIHQNFTHPNLYHKTAGTDSTTNQIVRNIYCLN